MEGLNKPRTAAQYQEACDTVCHAAGLPDPKWNQRFREALRQRGLCLASRQDTQAASRFLYPAGGAFAAPLPYGPDTEHAWEPGTYIVWALQVRVHPFREKLCFGNIIWAERDRGSSFYRESRFAMRAGKFPKDHPIGGEGSTDAQLGNSPQMQDFRARGYWASCFPEGDGITWKPLKDQPDAQCLKDIVECFPQWAVKWARGVVVTLEDA